MTHTYINYDNDPVFPEGNVYPPTWTFNDEMAWKLYRRSKREQWDEEEIDWEKVREIASGLDRKQRIAIAYWWSLLSNFDNATPVFAYALVKAFENHLPTAVKGIMNTIVFDENRHNIMCGLAINSMFPGFPDFKPQDDLERKARLNVLWTWYNGSRYWKGYLDSYRKYTLDILFTSFMMGEAAATTVFSTMGGKSTIPQFSELFKNTAVDETRHYAFTHLIMNNNAPKMTEEQKRMVTKQVRAGFVFLSVITYKAPKEFWSLPPWFDEVNQRMEEIARSTGFYIPDLEEKERAWRSAVIRVGSSLARHGIGMPAIPELGITGEEVKDLKEEDLIPTF